MVCSDLERPDRRSLSFLHFPIATVLDSACCLADCRAYADRLSTTTKSRRVRGGILCDQLLTLFDECTHLRNEIVALTTNELAAFFPRIREAKLMRSHVVKEVRATFSATPGLAARRPSAVTDDPRVFVAGDWTQTGWPSTMEGAVRSGYSAAEAVCRAAGRSSGSRVC